MFVECVRLNLGPGPSALVAGTQQDVIGGSDEEAKPGMWDFPPIRPAYNFIDYAFLCCPASLLMLADCLNFVLLCI